MKKNKKRCNVSDNITGETKLVRVKEKKFDKNGGVTSIKTWIYKYKV